jgi:DNA-binding GntR family transcriptional regulator
MITASRPAAAAQSSAEEGWQPIRPRTLVDMVIEALMSGAMRGLILPGDRIVESDVAQRLGVSRVPVREALRVLESQGIVINEPYKGIRLMPYSPERLDHLIEARVALETSAAGRAIRLGRNGEEGIAVLQRCIDEMELLQTRGDAYGFASADTGFHRALLGLSGNVVLCELWEGLSRQVTIFFGLSTLGKPMGDIVDEHRTLIAAFRAGDPAAMGQALDDHIRPRPTPSITAGSSSSGGLSSTRPTPSRAGFGRGTGGSGGDKASRRQPTVQITGSESETTAR